jgi:uncharacterized membrane protein YgdD (TMEM256/DUF423 family)
MTQSLAYRISALLGFLGVALGAFGAHGLKDVLVRNDTAAVWQTAVLYHLVHAVVMLGLASGTTWRRGAWLFLLVGVLVFSGSLYVMGVTNLRRLGMITPLGGVAFLVGWALLVVQGVRAPREPGTP